MRRKGKPSNANDFPTLIDLAVAVVVCGGSTSSNIQKAILVEVIELRRNALQVIPSIRRLIFVERCFKRENGPACGVVLFWL
ncbi:hypothetical protein Tco_0656583 [Tanacetum coccineum]|uniref:Cytochrome P450 n=1 Tax=Tanacetum coccineum TaxID=301880 RepID=A0ABQ4X999_9ASTR